MAPRRLILAMIMLLAVSTIVAMLAPDPRERDSAPTERTTERGDQTDRAPAEDTPGEQSEGRAKTQEGDSPAESRTSSNPEVAVVGGPVEEIAVAPDRRLVLEVRTDRTTEIAIPELGLLTTADPFAPALFDLISPAETTRLDVIELPSGRLVARVVVD